jgi:hypothetical protein
MIVLHAELADAIDTYQCTADELTDAIETYLPATAERLRTIAEDRTDGDTDLRGVPVGGLLIILADLDHELTYGAVAAQRPRMVNVR